MDATSASTSYSYERGRRVISSTTPAGAITTYAYDRAGRISSVTSEGNVVRYDYDADNRLLGIIPGSRASRDP